MITFLKANQKLKFSMKIGQLIFFIFLLIHWINCLWYFVTDIDKEWFPPKDLDFRTTNAYTAHKGTRYNLFLYYAAIILMGNEILPTDYTELVVLTILLFFSTVFLGVIIGEFVALLSAITKNQRIKNDEADLINSVMYSLKIPEKLQDKVIEYHDDISQFKYITKGSIQKLISTSLLETIMLYQTGYRVLSIEFLGMGNSDRINSIF